MVAKRASAAMVALVLAGAAVAQAANPRPATIPALRTWHGGEGSFSLGRQPSILVPRRDRAGLADEAAVFAADLRRLTGRRAKVRFGNRSSLRRGEIFLHRSPHLRLPRGGYRLRIGRRTAGIAGRDGAGAFHGTRTILQLLSQGRLRAPAGRARDWPRYPQRGLMIDAGRKYYTPRWIRQHIRELAYLKLNYFHLHFSDDQGFRIESDSHPEIVSENHLSKRQLRGILKVARRYHVTVVPELDMPGHMDAALAAHPELQLADALGQRAPDRLDVTKPAARRFARDLITEYIALFGGRWWHMGADEYMTPAEYPLYPQLEAFARQRYGPGANAKDAIHGFENWVNRIVRAAGKTTRMWHDDIDGGSVVELDSSIVVEWWTNVSPLSDPAPPTPAELLDRGHRILNAGWFPTYYVVGATAGPANTGRPDMGTAYESWEVNRFVGPICDEIASIPTPVEIPRSERRNLGSVLHVWNDDPAGESEEQTAAGIATRLRVLAQKTWGSPRLVPSYAAFVPIMNAVGRSPGFKITAGPVTSDDGRSCTRDATE